VNVFDDSRFSVPREAYNQAQSQRALAEQRWLIERERAEGWKAKAEKLTKDLADANDLIRALMNKSEGWT